MLKKERIKTVILCLLILNCIQLTGRIWLDKKLWPTGYNFFHYAGNIPIFGRFFNNFDESSGVRDEQMYSKAIMPRRIIAGDGSGRSVFYSKDQEYDEIMKIAIDILKGLNIDLQSDTINREQIEKYLVNKAIYFDFGYTGDFAVFLDSFEVNDSKDFSDKQHIAGSIIIAAEALENKTAVCFLSPDGEQAVRYKINDGRDIVSGKIDSLKAARKRRYAFTFDLNLHENVQSDNALLLSPFVLLNMEEKEGTSITVSDIFKKKKSISEISDKIVTAFGYNPSSLRKAVNNRGTVKYIENNATVTVYPDGIVEYSAAASGMGIKISNRSDVKSAIKDVLAIAGHIYRITDNDVSEISLLSGSSYINSEGNYSVNLDCYINGIPIKFGNNGECAVVSVIENGFIKEFKMHIADIRLSDDKMTWTSVLDAINIYADRNIKRVENEILNDVYECYCINENEASPGWYIYSSSGKSEVVANQKGR